MKCSEVLNLYPETYCTLLSSKLRVPPRVSVFITSLIWGPPVIINLIFRCFLSSCDSLYLTKEIKHPNLLFFSLNHPSVCMPLPKTCRTWAGGLWLSRKADDFDKKRKLETSSGLSLFFNIHVKKKKRKQQPTKQTSEQKIQQAKKKKRQKI